MKELKFIKVLSQIPKVELVKIEKFFNSPYCNANPLLYKILKYVLPEIKGSIQLKSEKELIWASILPGTKFNDTKWRKLCNDFLVTLQEYFMFEQLSRNDMIAGNLLLEYLNLHNLDSLFKSSANQIQVNFSKYKFISSDIYLQKFLLERNLYDLSQFDINMELQSNQESIHLYLDLFYLTEKMKQLVNVATRRHDFNIPIRVIIEQDIFDIIKKNNFLAYPEIDIYYRIYKLKQDIFNQTAYDELKKELYENLISFSHKEAVDILKEVINYCTLQYNQGHPQFGNEQLQWYKYGLNHDLIFPDNKFHPGHFLNIVLFGIRTKEFTWTENFIAEYQKIIPQDQKHTLVTFSLARLYFNQHKFDQVIEQLRDVEFDELTYNLDSKVLLLATYYEVEEFQAMISLADSFRTFINRHEKDITAAKKLRYSNFTKYIKKLSKVKYQDKAAKLKLLKDILGSEGVVNQGWLVEKANGL